jgi:hypothetical protein
VSVLDGILTLVSIAYPPAGTVIGVIQKAMPLIDAAIPVVQAAIKEGPGAFEAAKKASPELAKAISDISSHLFGSTHPEQLERVTSHLFGLHQMTTEEEKSWMDRASAPSAGGA